MMAFSGHRGPEAQRMVDFIKGREWGLMILDEVQTVPATKVRAGAGGVRGHGDAGREQCITAGPMRAWSTLLTAAGSSNKC